MPFGLCNAPQTMSRLMDEIIPPDLRYCVFGYLDDLVIVSEDFPSHIDVLVRIASQFRKANLTLNVSKSKFCGLCNRQRWYRYRPRKGYRNYQLASSKKFTASPWIFRNNWLVQTFR